MTDFSDVTDLVEVWRIWRWVYRRAWVDDGGEVDGG
jgi:hypothetical protein